MDTNRMEPNTKLEEIMIRYIRGELSEIETSKIKERIKNSKEDFMMYVSLQEAFYLMKKGRDIQKSERDTLMNLVTKREKINHIQLIVRFLKDQIIISSSDQEELNYQGIMAKFAYRGSKPGPVSISREFDGKIITFIFTPSMDKKSVFLSLNIDPEIEMSAILSINRSEAEKIKSTLKNKSFETPIPSPSDVEVEFIKNKKSLFSVGIKFHTEV
jgi:hypothetical protein